MSFSTENKIVRFTADDDLCLLKEILGHNPLKNPDNWNNVKFNMKCITGKEFLIRTLKDHLFLLLAIWKKKTGGDQKKSGVEEMYTEKDRLLQDISDLCGEVPIISNPKKRKMSKEKQIVEVGRKMREETAINFLKLNNFQMDHNYFTELPQVPTVDVEVIIDTPNTVENVDFNSANKENIPSIIPEIKDVQEIRNETPKKILGPTRSRPNRSVLLRKNALDYLNKKSELDQEIKLKELRFEEKKINIEKRRLDLEERKVTIKEKTMELEFEERQRKGAIEIVKMQLEVSQQKDAHALIEAQQRVINTLLKRLQKYEEC